MNQAKSSARSRQPVTTTTPEVTRSLLAHTMHEAASLREYVLGLYVSLRSLGEDQDVVSMVAMVIFKEQSLEPRPKSRLEL